MTTNHFDIWQVAVSRLREFYRQPAAVFWVFGFPISMLLILGLTFTDRPPETLQVDVLVPPNSSLGQRLRSSLKDDPRIVLHEARQEPLKHLQRVASSLVVVLHSEDDGTGELPATQQIFQLTFDPDRPDSVQARSIVELHIARLVEQAPAIEVIESPSLGVRYVDFLIPGLMAVNSMGASLVWLGYGLCEWRMLGLLRSLLATPLSKTRLLLGLLWARFLLLVPETLVLLIVARLVFGFIPQGSWPALILVQLIGATAFAAIGLLIGARGRGLESASGWLSVLMLSQWVFCGVFFSRNVFPLAWQPWITYLPLSLYVDAARGVLLNGDTMLAAIAPLSLLLVWAAVCGWIGLQRFRSD